jgi:hypothetical protein
MLKDNEMFTALTTSLDSSKLKDYSYFRNSNQGLTKTKDTAKYQEKGINVLNRPGGGLKNVTVNNLMSI